MQKETPTVVFLGDSHFAKFPLEEVFMEVEVLNRGISGNTSQQVLDRALDAVPLSASKVVIGVGINDLLQDGSAETVERNMSTLLQILGKDRPRSKLIVLSLMPTGDPKYDQDIREGNVRLRAICAEENVVFVDLYEQFVEGNVIAQDLVYDGLHLNDKGFARWVELIRPMVIDR